MTCNKCPFSLRCFAARLDAEEPLTLCVKCGKLMAYVENTFFRFNCELRKITEELQKQFRDRRRVKYPQQHVVADMRIKDPGPGLISELRVHYCVGCANNASIRRLYGIVIDLEELEKAREERGKHVFELEGATKRALP